MLEVTQLLLDHGADATAQTVNPTRDIWVCDVIWETALQQGIHCEFYFLEACDIL